MASHLLQSGWLKWSRTWRQKFLSKTPSQSHRHPLQALVTWMMTCQNSIWKNSVICQLSMPSAWVPGCVRNRRPNLKFWRLDNKLWSNSIFKKIMARSTAPGFWRLKPKAKILSRWQGHLLQAEVEPDAKQSSFEESIAKSPTPSYLWLINDWMAKIRIEN